MALKSVQEFSWSVGVKNQAACLIEVNSWLIPDGPKGAKGSQFKLINKGKYDAHWRECIVHNILEIKSWKEWQEIASPKLREDLLMGAALFAAFCKTPDNRIGMRSLSQDSFWKHLAVFVVPDHVWDRWYEEPKIKEVSKLAGRFYAHKRRIWPKAVWWYVNLTWQGDRSDFGGLEEGLKRTFTCLKNLGTDHALNLVERTSLEGYDVNFYRTLVKQSTPLLSLKNTEGKSVYQVNAFRNIMKLVNAFQFKLLPVESSNQQKVAIQVDLILNTYKNLIALED